LGLVFLDMKRAAEEISKIIWFIKKTIVNEYAKCSNDELI
jgi:hypothetical protein